MTQPLPPPPTSRPIFHITHWKAGSQWVRAVLAHACGHAIRPTPDMQVGRFAEPVEPGVYSPLYITRPNFERSAAARTDHRKFVVIRDLRDALVSWYFSLKHSHPDNPAVTAHREALQDRSVEDGLLYLLTHRDFAAMAMVPGTWIQSTDLILRYEALIDDPHGGFGRIFDHCGLDLPERRRAEAIERCQFERRAGRARGVEDPASHFRKGIAGDWRNHFTPAVVQEFKARFGHLLVKLGYEQDGRW